MDQPVLLERRHQREIERQRERERERERERQAAYTEAFVVDKARYGAYT